MIAGAVWTGIAVLVSVLLGVFLARDVGIVPGWPAAVSVVTCVPALSGFKYLTQKRFSQKRPPGGFPRTPVVFAAVELVLLVIILPLIGFLAAGAGFRAFPAAVPAGLALPWLAFVAANNPALLPAVEQKREPVRDRLVSAGLVIVALAGVLLAGRILPGSTEIRLLTIAPALVVVVLAPATQLFPAPSSGLRVCSILCRVTALAVAGVYVILAAAVS